MHRLLRLVVLSVVALAMPLKALAAAGLFACSPDAHAVATSTAAIDGVATADHDAGTHVQHDPSAAAGHGHGDHAGHVQASRAVDPPVGSLVTHDGHAPDTCGTCAPCCAAAAPATDPPRLSATPPDTRVPSRGAGYASDVAIDVPLRPPRWPHS